MCSGNGNDNTSTKLQSSVLMPKRIQLVPGMKLQVCNMTKKAEKWIDTVKLFI